MRIDCLVYCLLKPFVLISGLLFADVTPNPLGEVQTEDSGYEFVLVYPNEDNKNFCIELKGLPDEVTTQLASLSLSQNEWGEILAVYVGKTPQQTMPSMLGKYGVKAGTILFHPQFSLDEGGTYTAVFHPYGIHKRIPSADAANSPVQHTFTIPNRNQYQSTTVTKVYPTADELPENLLRMYIYFSQPMSRGSVYQYLQLLDENGDAVELPFLELDEELWDPNQQRFTLLFDPGRIKKELKPNLDTGLPLVAGHSYTFVVKKEWKDANGNPLQEVFKKQFRVTESDNKTPDPKQWEITLPEKDSINTLIIQFDEPLDHANAERLIVVKDKEQNVIGGTASIDEYETVYRFTPAQQWTTGDYGIYVHPSIEDRAGNSIMRPFDRDMTTPVQPQYTETIIMPFSVK